MSETIQVERFDNGLSAAFVQMPHFRTHSARLMIYAGSAHELPDEYGAAHFLEHVTFQGTDAMRSDEELQLYKDETGLSANAFTGQFQTCYMADGYELDSVCSFVNQLAMRPLLAKESLEKERNPVIDEIRRYASSPMYEAGIAHNLALRGELFARPVTADAASIETMTDEALKNYYNRHYKLANAILILCSPDSPDLQRETARKYTEDLKDTLPVDASVVDLGPFNPADLTSSLQSVDLPLTAQTSVSIAYGLPEINTVTDIYAYNLVIMMLGQAAHQNLRQKRALCYGAGAAVNRSVDLNGGRNDNWSHFSASASLTGKDAVTGLNALWDDVLHTPLSESAFEASLVTMRRRVDHILQSDPSHMANGLQGALSELRRDTIMPSEIESFANVVTLADLRSIQRSILDTKPLVLATSPDETVLQAVGNWAEDHSA